MTDQPKGAVRRLPANVFSGIPKQKPCPESLHIGNNYYVHVPPCETEFLEAL